MRSSIKIFKRIVEEKKTFVLTTHVNPDGDALGSEIALALFLKKQRKSAKVINHSATPPNYRFLDPQNEILCFDPKLHADVVKRAEVIFLIDTNQLSRLRSMEPFVAESKAVKVCIDHHLEDDDSADLYIVDKTAAAAGEIVYRLLHRLDQKSIDKKIARSLYTAIMTDTGSFRFPTTDPETHAIAADLIERGAKPQEIFQEVYEKGPINTLQLLGRALANLKTAHDGRVAYMIVTRKMFEETGTSEYQTDNFIDYTMRIGGVQIGLLFNELKDGVKVSLRSKGKIPVNELAKEFGGNGHLNAAGARLFDSDLEEIASAVLERSKKYLRPTARPKKS
jgi:phosphoesterase RecJ-like protein